MTPAEAQSLQDCLTAADAYIPWLVTSPTPDWFIARAMVADANGGHQERDHLQIDTLDTLRAILPAGLTRRDRTMMMAADVVETWD